MTTNSWRPKPRTLARVAIAALAMHGVVSAACDPPKVRKPVEMAPIGTVPIITRTVEEPDAGGTTTSPNSATSSIVKDAACTSAEFETLEDALRQCSSPMPRGGDVPGGMKDKLEVRVVAGTPSITPGGRVDLTVTLKNKSSEPLPLYFTGAPSPSFEIEAVDGKGKRVDLPAGKAPKTPAVPPRDVKAARITLAPGGTARVKIPWDAVKTRWAPEKAKSWEGRGYPRAAAGPLAAGKYTLRIVLPLIGELEVPKLPMDVGS